MTYQIVIAHPHYNDYDAVSGWSYEHLPNAYETLDCAFAIARRLDDGDGYSAVVPYGESALLHRLYPKEIVADDYCPY